MTKKSREKLKYLENEMYIVLLLLVPKIVQNLQCILSVIETDKIEERRADG